MKIPNILEDRFVAFIDILGFKGIVNNIENGSECFDKILSTLNFLDEETQESRYGSDLPIYELQDDKVGINRIKVRKVPQVKLFG
jgi:hypothetical protein